MSTLKVHYYMFGVCLLNFTFQYIFLFKFSILIHKYFCQINDFIMCLWHFNRYTLQKVHEDAKSEPL